MAARAGVSRDTVSKLEKGQHSPQASTLNKIARALGKAPSELLAEEESYPKAQAPLPLEPEAVGEGQDIVDRVYRLGELIWKGLDAEHRDRLEAGDVDIEWLERMTATIYAFNDVVEAIDLTQIRDPEAVHARAQYMADLNAKWIAINEKQIENIEDPEYRHRFNMILRASGEHMEALVANG